LTRQTPGVTDVPGPARSAARLLRPTGPQPALGFVAPNGREAVRELEDLGAASLWVGGHVSSPNPTPEAMVWLARLVEQSDRAVVGTATLLLPLFPPALVAKQVADLDRAAGGRLAIGIGVGGEYASDFEACGVPIEQRGSRTNEAMELLRAFWTGEPVTHHGRHWDFDALRIHPPPEQAGGPPIVVTGRQPVAMRRAARLGDGWMPYLYSPERYARSVTTIRDEAAQIGRALDTFTWCAYVFVCMDDDGDVARANAVAALGGTYRNDFSEMIERVAAVGTPEQVTERLDAFVAAGVEHFILCPLGPNSADTARRLVGEVASTVRPRPDR
jgi:alkanesulfonate monooxygenase SsuD/methylene tetrahydromethanopterin reductase-like flavin-dependent oxidoreductase (luciferase family)